MVQLTDALLTIETPPRYFSDGIQSFQQRIIPVWRRLYDRPLILSIATRYLNSNPGLRSRFKTFVNFPDYNADEPFDIFVKICKDQKNSLAPEAED